VNGDSGDGGVTFSSMDDGGVTRPPKDGAASSHKSGGGGSSPPLKELDCEPWNPHRRDVLPSPTIRATPNLRAPIHWQPRVLIHLPWATPVAAGHGPHYPPAMGRGGDALESMRERRDELPSPATGATPPPAAEHANPPAMGHVGRCRAWATLSSGEGKEWPRTSVVRGEGIGDRQAGVKTSIFFFFPL
jgi:hypothetical protein